MIIQSQTSLRTPWFMWPLSLGWGNEETIHIQGAFPFVDQPEKYLYDVLKHILNRKRIHSFRMHKSILTNLWRDCSHDQHRTFFVKTGEKSVPQQPNGQSAEQMEVKSSGNLEYGSSSSPGHSATRFSSIATHCFFLFCLPFTAAVSPSWKSLFLLLGWNTTLKNEMGWEKEACRIAEERLSQLVLEIQLLRTPEHREVDGKHTWTVDVVASAKLLWLCRVYLAWSL